MYTPTLDLERGGVAEYKKKKKKKKKGGIEKLGQQTNEWTGSAVFIESSILIESMSLHPDPNTKGI
jgi:hypothetical protein